MFESRSDGEVAIPVPRPPAAAAAWIADVDTGTADATTVLCGLEALERGGARMFFGHDPEFWRTVPQAPTAVS